MNLPAALFTIRWLIRDTFRQARANGIFWLMLGVSGLCIVFCLTISTDLPHKPADPERLPRTDPQWQQGFKPGVPRDEIPDPRGKIMFAFGAVPVEATGWRDDYVRFVQFLLLGLIADTGGILLALIWTAGFLPTFLEGSNAAVLLAKPVPCWSLLVGKYLGVLAFVAFQAFVFVGGIWLALALKTNVWDLTCWLAVPVLLLHFAVFFSFSALLAVTTRSTVACVFGSLLFWLICLAMNWGRHWAVPQLQDLPASFRFLAETGYWVLPKPADMGYFLLDMLNAQNDFAAAITREVQMLRTKGLWHPELSLLASGLAGLALLGVAAREFTTTDY